MATEYPTDTLSADSYFAMIPERLLYDTNLSSTDIRVYGALRRHADKHDGRCHPSHATIASKIGTSARTVRRSIEVLVASGWVESRRRFSEENGGWTSNSYRVLSILPTDRTPVSYAPDTSDLPHRTPVAEEPESVNQSQNSLPLSSGSRASRDKVPAAQIEEDFKEWYEVYPRKKKPADARRAYAKARKKATKEELLLGAQALDRLVRNQQQELKYTPYPASWLNAESWLEPPEPVRDPFTGPEMRYG